MSIATASLGIFVNARLITTICVVKASFVIPNALFDSILESSSRDIGVDARGQANEAMNSWGKVVLVRSKAVVDLR